jgi:beta-galactosidase/beta-glucuronidase
VRVVPGTVRAPMTREKRRAAADVRKPTLFAFKRMQKSKSTFLLHAFTAGTVGLMNVFFLQRARAAEQSTTSLDTRWTIAAQDDVKLSGEQLSTAAFNPSGWIEAQVPGTVFGSYVLAGLEPEPTYGDNIYKTDYKKYDRNFWYRTEFTVPSSYGTGHIWLNFDGVNRDADVYLNGHKLGSMHGFFQRGLFDVTQLIRRDGKNVMAVLDYLPPINPSSSTKPVRPVMPYSPVPRGENYSSPSFICSRGWDWMPPVPGLNMGVYKDVYLTKTGDVSLIDPWIRTLVPSQSEGAISIQANLANHLPAAVQGELVGEINPGHITFRKTVSLEPNGTATVKLDADATPVLKINNPRLWWPNGYGDPNLYTCHLEFRAGSTVSDQKDITFGIRQYTYDTDNDIMHFHINGVKIFPKGGSWGMAEFMLRCHGSDYDEKLRFHKEENFNIIRNWMGMTADQAFYDACDKYGVMVWDEFWLNSSGGRPADVNVYEANVIEKIKQVRNHPSIVFWAAENEGVPPPDVNNGIVDAINTTAPFPLNGARVR